MKFYLFVFIYLLSVSVCFASSEKCVVLLHGLARSHHAMSSIESTLKQHNYRVINEDYPSTKKSIETIANQDIQPMVDQCLSHHPDHIMFVTHSMGGIVLQQYLENHTVHHLSHIIMLSPPNHGSPLADLLHNNWLFQKIMGPAGQELLTSQVRHKLSVRPVYQIGIIAGNFNFIPFLHAIFRDASDGKVSVSSARLEYMSDFIVLPVGHTFMMKNAEVKKQILYFLRFGKFEHVLR